MQTLDVALRCLDHGLAVIPVWPDKRKNPKIDSYLEYLTRLPTPEEWRRWNAKWPNANIAAITGYWLNYVCLDFDTLTSYEFWRLGPGLGIAGQTWTVRTARGYHVWLQTKEDPGKSRVYRNNHHEVLLRARGGYCIIPPSIHHTGARYTTISKCPVLLINGFEYILKGYTYGLPKQLQPVNLPNLTQQGSITIGDMITGLGKVNYRGAQQAFCLFHEDSHPSAWVNIGQGRFGCNRCFPDMYFDAVNVYAMLNQISNGEAYKALIT